MSEPDQGLSLASLLSAAARRGAVLVDRGKSTLLSEVESRVARVAGGLAGLGIRPGDRVAIWLPNVSAWLETFFAISRLGAIAVPVNTRFRITEVENVLRRTGARVLVYWPGFKHIDFAGILAGCDAASLTSLEAIVVYSESDAETEAQPQQTQSKRLVEYGSLSSAAATPDAGTSTSDCVMFTTSGTTKEPKLVLHVQRTLVQHACNVANAWRLDPTSSVLLVPPMCGVYGFCTALAALAGGGALRMRPVWDANVAADEITEAQCTHMTGTDDVYAQLLDTRPGVAVPFPSLRVAGFAAFNPALTGIVQRAEAHGLHLSGLYGTSEVLALFSLRSAQADASQRPLAGGFSVSAAAKVRTRDPEEDRLLPHGEAGALEIWAPESRMVRYFGNEEATGAALTSDGWYRTGDLGYTTDDGAFVYMSRLGDTLRLGGFLVSPAEIEAVVKESAGVGSCQVVGVARPGGLRAIAFVIPEPGKSIAEEELASHVRQRLASFKVPERFFFVDAFPVTESANGSKITKNKLRQLAETLLHL